MRGLVLIVQACALCVLSSSVALGASTKSKSAKDARAQVYKAAPLIPISPWTGFYAGANIGGGWGKMDATVGGVTGSTNVNGVIGGLQAGYNWQTGAMVLGIETDIQASGQRRTDNYGLGFATAKIPYFGTLRGRVGYATPTWLAYFTGGLAYGRYQLDATLLGVSDTASAQRAAWTVGGGVEAMFGPRWSAKLEYLYIDTGTFGASLYGVGFDTQVRNHIVRIGANYHF